MQKDALILKVVVMAMFRTVFLMLGEGCNFSCKYCLQHPILTEQLPTEINPKLISYLLNMKVEKEQKIRIMFYGGEPLLYWGAIFAFVNLLRDSQKFSFGIITNGQLLSDEMVTFIKENNIGVCISNDGRNTENFRDKNVLEDEVLLRRYEALNTDSSMFGVSSVVSAKNFNIREDILN
jgi:uncharacterized protein